MDSFFMYIVCISLFCIHKSCRILIILNIVGQWTGTFWVHEVQSLKKILKQKFEFLNYFSSLQMYQSWSNYKKIRKNSKYVFILILRENFFIYSIVSYRIKKITKMWRVLFPSLSLPLNGSKKGLFMERSWI